MTATTLHALSLPGISTITGIPTSMIGVGIFIYSYWQYILIALIVSVGLAYAAFILRNWKLAVAAGAVVCMFLSHQIVYHAGWRAKARAIEIELSELEKERNEVITRISKDHVVRAAKDAARIKELEKLVHATPKNPRTALPRDVAGRVQSVR